MKKINALFVGMVPDNVNSYRNVFFQNLIFALADKGVDCTVISPVSVTQYRGKVKTIPKVTKQITPGGKEVTVYYPRYFSASAKQVGPFNTIHISESLFEKAALRIAKKLKKKFDFVYGHFFLNGGLAAIKVGRKLGLPTFVAYGECDFESQIRCHFGSLTPKHIEGLTGVIAVSTKNANELKDEKIFDDIPMIIAPNATDKSMFVVKDKEECREKLGLPKDKFIVGFVGGFIPRKGDRRLLEAVNSIDNVYLAFAGRGDNPPCGEKVLFCKALEHEEVCTFLNAVDIFCLPTQSEGSCNAVVEAMSCGKTIVSSDLPFNYDALNSENSILVNPDSVEEIRAAIQKLYNDEELRNRLSQKALLDSEKFSIEKRADNILNFIGEQLEK
ncbi:MAG: glycosyltransferase family 4 protein [Clostridia bacterium]|nr:glycosyltransferase family 4 protein [Clostridia bacterium]